MIMNMDVQAKKEITILAIYIYRHQDTLTQKKKMTKGHTSFCTTKFDVLERHNQVATKSIQDRLNEFHENKNPRKE